MRQHVAVALLALVCVSQAIPVLDLEEDMNTQGALTSVPYPVQTASSGALGMYTSATYGGVFGGGEGATRAGVLGAMAGAAVGLFNTQNQAAVAAAEEAAAPKSQGTMSMDLQAFKAKIGDVHKLRGSTVAKRFGITSARAHTLLAKVINHEYDRDGDGNISTEELYEFLSRNNRNKDITDASLAKDIFQGDDSLAQAQAWIGGGSAAVMASPVFDDADANKDGGVTLDEAKDYFTANSGKFGLDLSDIENKFAAANGDSETLDKDEFANFVASMRKPKAEVKPKAHVKMGTKGAKTGAKTGKKTASKSLFQQADIDNSKTISLDEATAFVESNSEALKLNPTNIQDKFTAADTNNDGELDETEFDAFIKSLKAGAKVKATANVQKRSKARKSRDEAEVDPDLVDSELAGTDEIEVVRKGTADEDAMGSQTGRKSKKQAKVKIGVDVQHRRTKAGHHTNVDLDVDVRHKGKGSKDRMPTTSVGGDEITGDELITAESADASELTFDQVKELLTESGDLGDTSDEDLREMFKAADIDGNGVLDSSELKTLKTALAA